MFTHLLPTLVRGETVIKEFSTARRLEGKRLWTRRQLIMFLPIFQGFERAPSRRPLKYLRADFLTVGAPEMPAIVATVIYYFSMDNCIFCAIVSGKSPSHVVEADVEKPQVRR